MRVTLRAGAIALGLALVAGLIDGIAAGILGGVLGASAVMVQWIAWVPAAQQRSEKAYDLYGSATFLALLVSLVVVAPDPGPRALFLVTLVATWTLRLGLFLVRRVHAAGSDGRFDAIKQDPSRFLVAWSLQGLWVALCLAPVLAVGLGPDRPLGFQDLPALVLWGAGFGLEVVADAQKRAFRADPANAGRWIEGGVWSWSRHPNYLGEIGLWWGIFGLAAPALAGWGWAALVGPVFVTLLLRFGSGVPPLEARAEARWGADPAWQDYKRRTPVLFPGLGG